MSAVCPVCGSRLNCPCHACRSQEAHGFRVKHYGFRAGIKNKPDVICCPDCGFSGEIREWRMEE